MTTYTIDWTEAIDSIRQFELDIDDDFDSGVAGFRILDAELKTIYLALSSWVFVPIKSVTSDYGKKPKYSKIRSFLLSNSVNG